MGIPTTYEHIQFRSRLEAKWAAFFDCCDWPWHYEPLDLPGWIPDFALGWKPTLVEVKPAFHPKEFEGALAKITASGYRDPVVLLGAVPRFEVDAIGWIAEWCPEDGPTGGEWVLHDLDIGFTEGNGRLGLCPMEAGWVNVIWNAPRDHPSANKWARVWDLSVDGRHSANAEDVPLHWRSACNSTQWMARK